MTADEYFAKGLAELDLSRGADSQREYRSDLEGALAAFDAALKLDPQHEGARRQRAFTLASLDRHAEAAGVFAEALQRRPSDPDLLLGFAQSLARLELPERALAPFDGVLALRPGDVEALFGRAAALTELGRYAQALAAWETVLAAAPGDFRRLRAAVERAVCLARLDRPEAHAAFRELFERDGKQLHGPLSPKAVQTALDDLEVAQAAFREWTDAHAGDATTWWVAGRLWQSVQAFDEAQAAFENLVRLKPDDAQAWFAKGEAHLAAEQRAEAEAAYRRAFALWPEFLAAKNRLEALAAPPKRWKLMGHDTFAREDYVVGVYDSRAQAEAELRTREARHAATQDEGLRDELWIVEAP